MPRLNEQDKARNEAAVRAAMERILRGDLPPGAKADLKTLAELSRVTRTGFYAKRNRDGTSRPGAYQHLAEEFARRLQELQDAGEVVDPRTAQIERLKKENTELRHRIARRDGELAKLTEFRLLAISRLAAQHDEIERLRARQVQEAEARDLVTHLASRAGEAPFGSCS
ncbi:hypothetical protein [Streptomyces lunaelactis]|uniref:hypothetical protein n=1 Tax=Streptomyces lunaelactis TaxID=1535768 RepID=UPI002815A6B2|nr:hypothetical protein [Streptomyces lunaelactis]